MRFRDRLWFTLLIAADRLFGTGWVQREMDRRYARLAGYQHRMSGIQQEIGQLETRLEVLHVQLCLIYLRQRYMTNLENWLRFETGGEDEPGLDLVIEHLVKPRLAAVEMREIAPSRHVYHLRPDWPAIAAALGDATHALEPETLAWLQQRMTVQSHPGC